MLKLVNKIIIADLNVGDLVDDGTDSAQLHKDTKNGIIYVFEKVEKEKHLKLAKKEEND